MKIKRVLKIRFNTEKHSALRLQAMVLQLIIKFFIKIYFKMCTMQLMKFKSEVRGLQLIKKHLY